MEWAAEEALRCPGCNWPRDVSMRDRGDADFEVTPYECHVCNTKHQHMESRKSTNPVYFKVTDTAPAE